MNRQLTQEPRRLTTSTLVAALAVAGNIFLTGCQYTTRLAGDPTSPITLGITPTEIVFRHPITSWKDTGKSIRIHLQVNSSADLRIPANKSLVGEDGREHALYFRDGRKITARATIFLEDGRSIETEGTLGGCLEMNEMCSIYFELPYYRERIAIKKIQIVTSGKLVALRIELLEGDLL